MKILLVDGHILFREGLASLLSAFPDMNVIGHAGTSQEALAKVKGLQPDLVILEAQLPDGSGLEIIKDLHGVYPEAKVVVLTTEENDDLLFSSLRFGAKGFLLKNTPISDVVVSLKAVAQGEAALTRGMTGRLVEEYCRLGTFFPKESLNVDCLTYREMEVLNLLREDISNQDIAMRLNIATNTVKVHIHNILSKLQLRSRAEAASFSRRYSLSGSNDGMPEVKTKMREK